MFNQGFICPNCGPVQESKKRSIAKVQYDCCKLCEAIVNVWERPMNERAGRCGNCAHAHFRQMLENGYLKRVCHKCEEIYNIDIKKVEKKGKGEFEWRLEK